MAFSHPHQTQVTPRWCPPPPGALELNFAGSAFGKAGYEGIGGVIRNTEGTTLLSHSGPAGFCSSNKAALLALRIGLREASNLNPQWLFVEGDSHCVI